MLCKIQPELVVIDLEGDPRGWGRARVRVVTPKGKKPFPSFFVDAETKAYKEALTWKAKAVMRSLPRLQGPLQVRIIARMGVPPSWSNRKRDAALAGTIRPTGKPDWDNIGKLVDAFNEVVWDDDAQIVDGSVSKIYSESPSLRIEIRTCPVLG